MKLFHCFTVILVFLSGQAAAFPLGDRVDSRLDPGVLKTLEAGLAPTVKPFAGCRGALSVQAGFAPVVIEIDNVANPFLLDKLERAGLVMSRAQGRRLFYRKFVPGLVDEGGIEGLLALPQVVKIFPSLPLAPLPLDLSASLMDRDEGWGARPALDLLTGAGVTVADIDSNIDVFHPHFFKGDAGYYDWIDVDENGIFETGVDAVDLDRNGAVDDAEVAELLRAEMLESYSGVVFPARSSDFDPAIDWIYLDSNGNGERDFGADSGFGDADPAFGEPLFAPDDLNLSGTLDPGERLVRLGSSKIRKVYVDTTPYPLVTPVSRVFERGVDLAEHRSDLVGAVYGYSEALHATGVLSIVAGDLPLAGRRFVGVAPDAELLLGFELGGLPAAALAWALGESPDVVLHELAPWSGEVLDGTDAFSAMVNTSAVEDHVSHSCPVGNTAGARKHARVELDSAEKIIDFDIPNLYGLNYVNLSINIVGSVPEVLIARGPESVEIDFLAEVKQLEIAPQIYAILSEKVTSKGTQFYDLILYTNGGAMDAILGDWSLAITAGTGASLAMDGYLMDNVSGWAEGAAWSVEFASDDRTIGIPAVSESCVAVGAYTAHWDEDGDEWWYSIPGERGYVRYYSGRGPTIDGRPKPDVVAPDNPWAAAPHGASLGDDLPHGALSPFGGTSGAGPHVAGVAAMLAQAGIRGESAKQAIQQGAVSDEITGPVPNADYGWGRLNAAGALAVSRGGERPVLELTADASSVRVPGEIVLRATATDPDSAHENLEIKWDDGYDGIFDGEYDRLFERKVSVAEVGVYPFRARVRDEGGHFAEAVVFVTAVEGDVETDTASDAGAEDTDLFSDGGGPLEAVSGDKCDCRFVGQQQAEASLWGMLGVLGLFGQVG